MHQRIQNHQVSTPPEVRLRGEASTRTVAKPVNQIFCLDETEDAGIAFDFSASAPSANLVLHRPAFRPSDRSVGQVLRTGWGDPEFNLQGNSWVWATDTSASLELSLMDEMPRQPALLIHAWPFEAAGKGPQRVAVSLNGSEVGEMTLKGVGTYKLPVSRESLRLGINTIDFRFGYAISPNELGQSEDTRQLAAAFDLIALVDLSQKNSGLAQVVRNWVGMQGEVSLPSGGSKLTDQSIRRGVNLVQDPGTQLVFQTQVPEGGVLTFGLKSLFPPQTEGRLPAGVSIAIGSSGGDLREIYASEKVQTGEIRLDVSEFAGSDREIVFSVTGPKVRDLTEGVRNEGSRNKIIWIRPKLRGRELMAGSCANLIYIVVDTLRADVLGAYGGEAKTPNIDALARSGALFAHAYSHYPATGPSHASQFTSLLPSDHGVTNNAKVMASSNETLAELMKSSGRATAGFVSLGVLKSNFGFDQGFDEYSDEFIGEWFKSAEQINQMALPWLESVPARPFFLWLHYSDPHEPYGAPGTVFPEIDVSYRGEVREHFIADGRMKTFSILLKPGRNIISAKVDAQGSSNPIGFHGWGIKGGAEPLYGTGWRVAQVGSATIRFLDGSQGELIFENNTRSDQKIELRFMPWEDLDPETTRSRYIAEVEFLDAQIGKVYETLGRLDLLERTLIVFTSDHGESLGEHGLIGHSHQLYEPLIRVPLIFSWPSSIPSGLVFNESVGHVDVLPTIQDLLGMPRSDGIRGRSLVGLIEGDDSYGQRHVVSQTFHPGAARELKSIIVDRKKLIRNEDLRTLELYDLTADPDEMDNLSSQQALFVEETNQQLSNLIDDDSILSHSADMGDLDDESIQQLRALGYVEN